MGKLKRCDVQGARIAHREGKRVGDGDSGGKGGRVIGRGFEFSDTYCELGDGINGKWQRGIVRQSDDIWARTEPWGCEWEGTCGRKRGRGIRMEL